MSVNVKVTTSSGNKISVSPKTNKNNVVVSRRAVLSAETTGDKNYVHDQDSPSATWTINHTLSKFPSVSIVDSAGTLIIAEIEYVSTSQLVITFDASTSGKAYLN